MNLYLIWQSVNQEYDTYDSAVVAAKTEEEARATPVGHMNYEWAKPEDVQVKLIGKAVRGTMAGVILASYNAG